MTPPDPPEGAPISGGPVAPSAPTRSRSTTWFGAESPSRRFLARWGFPLFVLVIVILGRGVLLPFVFAGLIAYILAPVVRWMSERKDGTRRMPRGLAIIICYIVFIAAVVGFMFLVVPKLARDIKRLSSQISMQKINEEWTPEVAHWLEERFPSLAVKPPAPEDAPAVSDSVPLPPDTAFTLTPLPDGRTAVQLAPNGVDIKPTEDGGYQLKPVEQHHEALKLEDKLRAYVKHTIAGLQSKLNDAVRVMQDVITGFVKGIFAFFFTLMIGAFILIDVEKVHAFLRSLFPANVREDYDVIIDDIDRGLSGVIRGQLVICLINACLTYVGLHVFGVNYKLILAILAGLMSLIPIFGSILSSIPIVIVALVSGDEGIEIWKGVAMVLWIVGIHLIEANVLNPKIIGTAAKIHPVLVIFALFLGEASYGLVGALLAVPILSAVQVVFMYFYRKTWKDAPRKIAGESSGPVRPPPEAAALPPTAR
jgi:predicted PurR-regulated permease PerM